jgi:hypothetical protein
MTVYQLGSIIFNDLTPDLNGALWIIDQEIEGWASPPVRSSFVQPPTVHGGVTVEGLYGPRVFTLAGICKGGSSAGYYASQTYLQAQTNRLRRIPGSPLTFTATEEVGRQCEVVRAGFVNTRNRGGSTFEFQITLRADDPRKYSTTEHNNSLVGGAGEVINNAGNIQSFPRFNTDEAAVHGLHNSTYSYDWTTSASTPNNADIDMKAMTVLVGTTSYFDNVDSAAIWWALESGNNTVLSDQDVTIFWRDAWI